VGDATARDFRVGKLLRKPRAMEGSSTVILHLKTCCRVTLEDSLKLMSMVTVNLISSSTRASRWKKPSSTISTRKDTIEMKKYVRLPSKEVSTEPLNEQTD
jgi:hypothetical protein